MTPEEKINQQIWEILQGIKEEILATVTGGIVKYRIPSFVGVGIIPKHRRIKILYKLEEMGAFKVQRNSAGTRIGTGDIFYLIINSEIFDKVYEKYRKTCDLTGHLNDYQDKVFKGGGDLPKFAQVKHSESDKKSENPKIKYSRLLNEIKSREKSSDLKKRYKKTLKQIESENNKSVTATTEPSYNSNTSEILFMGKKTPIPNNTNQDALCRILFKNKKTKIENWSAGDVLEKWGGGYDPKKDWRKVYNAGREINKKVAIETAEKDLLVVRKFSVRVNPKFLDS